MGFCQTCVPSRSQLSVHIHYPSAIHSAMSAQTFQPLLRSIVEFSQKYHHSNPLGQPASALDSLILAQLRTTIAVLADEKASEPAQFAGLLTALSVSGLDKHEQVIQVFVEEILAKWNRGAGAVDQRPSGHDPLRDPVCDIVGTGGDGFNTFNVSTTAAIVAAGAGVKVCKHGNRASSSASGSADLLMASGIPLDRLQPTQVASLVQDPSLAFNFLFSPTFYPIFARLSPIRRTLGFPTIFNLLGPLLNPARPDRLIIGVPHPALGPIFCRVLQLCGLSHSWVVSSDEGLDEISTAGESSIWQLAPDGSIVHMRVCPEASFGLERHPIDLLTGDSAQQNLDMLNDLLDYRITTEKHRAILDFVLINTSALLLLAGKADDYKQGVELARESLRSGNAKNALLNLRKRAQELVALPAH